MRNKNIKLVFEDGKKLSFKKYKHKKGSLESGFAYPLSDSSQFIAYKIINSKFFEGHSATSSMVKEVPNRFTHFISYYFSSKPEAILQPLPSIIKSS